jgi:phosphoribosylformylglycinamidine cyclo-ligase
MYQVFNMGHRLEFYVPEAVAAEIIEISGQFDIEARIVGHVESSDQKKLTIVSEAGRFEY